MSQLDPVQIEAIKFSWGKRGVGFNLEQGLGKTLVALTEFSFLHQKGRVDRMIVVCPNTFKRGWLDEIEKHGFDFDVHIWQSSKKTAAADWLNRRCAKPPVLIINYDAARMPGVLRALRIWAARGPTYLAIDESIQIKGHKSLQTKSVHHLAPGCAYVRILSGRMQTQGPHDLWGQLRAIGLFIDRNFYAFRGRYCVMGGWQDKEVLAAKNTEELGQVMAPWVFQAKKKDWLPLLPRKDATIRDYKMSAEQQRQYNQMEHQFLVEIESGVVSVEVAIAKYAKLAQIQCGFVYDDERQRARTRRCARAIRGSISCCRSSRRKSPASAASSTGTAPCCRVLQRARASYEPRLDQRRHEARRGRQSRRTASTRIPPAGSSSCSATPRKYGHTLLGGPGRRRQVPDHDLL